MRATMIVVGVLAAFSLIVPGISAAPAAASTQAATGSFRTINYFPAYTSQGSFWNPSTWSPSTIDADFALVASLKANSVRIFVPTTQFGYPTPVAPYTTELAQLVQLADAHGLKVYLNLFNYLTPYGDIPGSKQWVNGIVSPYAGDPRIMAVEIQNEINPLASGAIPWARSMINYLHYIDGGIPVAVSAGGWENETIIETLHTLLGNIQPDLYSFHYYTNLPFISQDLIQKAMTAVAPVPMIIGETGMSSGQKTPTGYTSTAKSQQEYDESQFYTTMATAAQNLGLAPPSPWTLYDFAPTPGTSNSVESYFGLFHQDGTFKPAAWAVYKAFYANQSGV